MGRIDNSHSFSFFQKTVAIALTALVPFATLPEMALALPHGGVVAKGSARMGYSTSTLLITQWTPSATFKWSSYNVKAGQSVLYSVPGSRSVSLNEIGGTTPSSIDGLVRSNGILFFMNPNGLIFGSGSVVNAAGVMAFGSSVPWGKPTGRVANAGVLTATDNGTVALVGTSVSNSGTISAPGGRVILAAGSTVTPLAVTGSSSLSVATTGGGLADDSGILSAETVGGKTGSILLQSGMGSGTTTLESTAVLEASAPNGGNGGTVETSGNRVNVADGAAVTTEAPFGKTGMWTLDPASFYIGMNTGPANPTSGQVLNYEDLSGSQLGTDLGSTSVVIDSTQGAKGTLGNIYVNDAVSWNSANSLTLNAVNNIQVNNTITATGTGGLALRADDMDIGGVATHTTGGGVPSGIGTVNLNTGGSLDVAGPVSVYYNPSTYTTPTVYHNSGAGTVTPFMLLSSNPDLYYIDQNQNATILANNYALNANITLPTVTSASLSGADLTQVQTATGTNGETYSSGAATNSNWVRFGGSSINYSGTFDGLEHSVTDLSIDDTKHGTVGFVGFLGSGGGIENLGMVGGSVTAASSGPNVGELAGCNKGGTITNSFATGSVTAAAPASAPSAGGLVGMNSSGSITDSYATGNVSVTNSNTYIGTAGGLVGENVSGKITDSYATGNVTTANDTYTGGLVGANNAIIAHDYATGNVTATNVSAGGLVGVNGFYLASASITDSFATGKVTEYSDPYGCAGGLVGQNNGVIKTSYATGNVTVASISSSSSIACAGGLVGGNEGGATIETSYATGKVTATSKTDSAYAGGLAGCDAGSISNAYAAGNAAASGTSSYAGGLVGYNNSGTYAANYYNASATIVPGNNYGVGNATSSVSGVTGLSEGTGPGQLGNPGSYSGWSFASGWNGSGFSTSGTWIIGTVYPNGGTSGISAPILVPDLPTATVTGNSGTSVYSGISVSPGYFTIYTMGGASFPSGIAVSTSVGPNVGYYTVTPTLSGTYAEPSMQNSVDSITTASGTWDITPANLSATGSQVYNGTTGFKGSNLTVNGVDGQTFTASGTGTLGNSGNVQTNQPLMSVSGLTLTGNGGALASNYNPLLPPQTRVSVTPANLIMTATSLSVLSGTTPSTLSGTFSSPTVSSSLLSGDISSSTWTTPATSGSPPGSYAIDGVPSFISGMSENFTVLQAPGNATALTVTGGITSTNFTPVLQTVDLYKKLPPLPGTSTNNPSTSPSGQSMTLLVTPDSSLTLIQPSGDDTTGGGILSAQELKP